MHAELTDQVEDDHEDEEDEDAGDEAEEELVIPRSNAIINPRTVMVVHSHAVPADIAMLRPKGLDYLLNTLISNRGRVTPLKHLPHTSHRCRLHPPRTSTN